MENEYKTQGYLILRDFLNEIEIASISQYINPIFESWFESNKAEIMQQRLVNMHSLSHAKYFKVLTERAGFFNAITPSSLTQLMDSLFGSDLYFHNTQLFFNPINANKRPYWHRDLQYSPIPDEVQESELKNMVSLHVRIPLSQEKGLELIPGTHKRWDTELEKKVRFELEGHTQNDALPDGQLIVLNVGDVLIFGSQMIHRGNYRLNSSRQALDLCVSTHHPLTFKYFDSDVLPTADEEALIENKQWFQCAKLLCENLSRKNA